MKYQLTIISQVEATSEGSFFKQSIVNAEKMEIVNDLYLFYNGRDIIASVPVNHVIVELLK